MTVSTDKIPDSLEKDLREGNVVPFIGAGISHNILTKESDSSGKKKSLFPLWSGFIEIVKKRLKGEALDSKLNLVNALIDDGCKDFPQILQEAFNGLHQDRWSALLKDVFGKSIDLADEQSLDYPRELWNFNSNLLITTNIDRVLESVHQTPYNVDVLDTQIGEFANVQRDWRPLQPTIIYLHGQVTNAHKTIFTKSQYQNFYEPNKESVKIRSLQNLLSQRTILFLGFSLEDAFILNELEKIHVLYEGEASRFYILLHENEKDNPKIPEYITRITYKDYGQPFLDKLKELSAIANKDNTAKEEHSSETTNEQTKTSSNDERTPFFNVPFASKEEGFIGRKDKLGEIHESLKSGRATHIGQAQNIQGMGGLGKTQLAVEYAHRYRKEYQRGVYWLTADADIDNQLITIGEAEKWIFRDDKAVNQFDVAKARFLELKDCLIIFDNVETVTDIKSYIPADKKSVHLLITSREEQNGFRQIDLNVLSPADSKELLLSIAGREPADEAEKEAFEQLIEELDGLPLALELVGGYLAKRKNISFQNYFKYFNTEPLEKIEARFPDETFTNHDISIIRTLTISEELLSETSYLADILDVLAWSGSSTMSVSLLREMVQPENDFEFEDALALALELKLLKKDEETERYAIHRLLGRVRRLEKPLEQNQEWHQKTLNGLIRWFSDRRNDFNYLTEFEEMLEHLDKWEDQSFDLFKIEIASLIWLKSYPSLHRGNYRISKMCLDKALNIYINSSDTNQELEINLIFDLASVDIQIGNYLEALKYQEKVLSIQKEMLEDKHPSIASSYNNLASIYRSLNDFTKALNYQTKALKIQKKLPKEYNFHVAISYNNIGSIYSVLGEHKKALKYQEKSLTIREELLGTNHPHTAGSYNNVGLTYGKLGDFQKALEYQKKSLEIQLELFGDNHPNTASAYNNVGNTYQKLGNYQKALEYQKKSLEMHQNLSGKQHPTTIFTAFNTIVLYQELKNMEKAGKIADSYFKYVPQNHEFWHFFEELSRPYRKKHNPFKKKRK